MYKYDFNPFPPILFYFAICVALASQKMANSKTDERTVTFDLDASVDDHNRTLAEIAVNACEPFEIPSFLAGQGITAEDLIEAQQVAAQERYDPALDDASLELHHTESPPSSPLTDSDLEDLSLQLSDADSPSSPLTDSGQEGLDLQLSDSDCEGSSTSSNKENRKPKKNDTPKDNQVLFSAIDWAELMGKVTEYLRWPVKERRHHWPFPNMDRDRKNAWKKLCKDYELKDNFLMKRVRQKTKRRSSSGIKSTPFCKYISKSICYFLND